MKDQNINRRTALGKISALGVVGSSLFQSGCESSPTLVEDTAGHTATGHCVLTPKEDTGPYPLSSVLDSAAIKRQIIHEDKPGVPVTLQLKLFDVNNGCAPVTDAKIYVWHCDKDGAYSGYSQTGAGAAGETFCRGVQTVDAQGIARFKTIYPGWYPGRVTHMHFQVFRGSKKVTSQLAFPLETNRQVYATELYQNRGQNYSVSKLSDDFEFENDGAIYQTVSISGSLETELLATLEIGIR